MRRRCGTTLTRPVRFRSRAAAARERRRRMPVTRQARRLWEMARLSERTSGAIVEGRRREHHPECHGAARGAVRPAKGPCGKLRHKSQRRQREIDDKQPVPGRPRIVEWAPNHRSERRKHIEKNVTGQDRRRRCRSGRASRARASGCRAASQRVRRASTTAHTAKRSANG